MLKLLGMPDDTQAWARFDKRAKTSRTTSSSGLMWENVTARITIDDKTGHIKSLEYTKKQERERDVHRNLPSTRDIRALLLHCSPVTPKQQLKQSFQTFATPAADETRHLTSQNQPVLQDDLSDGSDRSGVISKECSNPSFCQP